MLSVARQAPKKMSGAWKKYKRFERWGNFFPGTYHAPDCLAQRNAVPVRSTSIAGAAKPPIRKSGWIRFHPRAPWPLLHSLLGEDDTTEPIKPILIEWTEGNPFFLEESVRAMAEAVGRARPAARRRGLSAHQAA
jgi:hypothetical protein